MRPRLTLTALAGAAAVLLAAVPYTGAAQATAAPATAPHAAPVTAVAHANVAHATAVPTAQLPGVHTFVGVAKTDGCSASLVRFAVNQPADKALMMTNGHCTGAGVGINGDYKFNFTDLMYFTILTATGESAGMVKTDKLAYTTMTSTDVAFYQLNETYSEMKTKYGSVPLTISVRQPAAGTSVVVASGFWKSLFPCRVDRTPAGILIDAEWGAWAAPAIGYTLQGDCRTKAGASGSPVLDAATGEVISIHNSGNDTHPGSCTGNATCEVDAQGVKTAYGPAGYATPVTYVTTCLNARRVIDIKVRGCMLPGGDAAVKRPW